MNLALFVALVAAVASPVVAYITTSRRLSGKISHSDADSLWAESASIREDYRSQIRTLREQLSESQRRERELERRIQEIEDECARKIRDFQEQIDTLETKLDNWSIS